MKELLKVIERRHSTRTPFNPKRAIPREHLRTILEAARWSPTAHNMQNFEIVVVEERGLLEALSAIRGSASESFIRENYAQLSFSEEELACKKVGILGTMFPPAWRTPGGAPGVGGSAEPPSQTRLAAASAALIVVLYDPRRRAPASEGDFLGIVSLGCVMQSMWLAADSLGVGFQILSALSAEGAESEVRRLLGVPDELKVAYTARLGYPSETPHYLRVRRDIADFAHLNRYGNRGLA